MEEGAESSKLKGGTLQVGYGANKDEIASFVSLTREILLQKKIGAGSAGSSLTPISPEGERKNGSSQVSSSAGDSGSPAEYF